MHPALNIAVKAARRAGQIINRASNDLDLIQVTTKQPNDFVTEVDKAAEAAIIDTLRDAYPEYRILAEVSGSLGGKGGGVRLYVSSRDVGGLGVGETKLPTAQPILFTACRSMLSPLHWPKPA